MDRSLGGMVRTLLAAVSGAAVVAAGVVPGVAAAVVSSHGHPAVAAHHGPGTPKHAQGDIDGDGRSDLVAGKEHSIRITYTSATPGGNAIQSFALPDAEAPLALATGDYNGDGFADLAVGSPFSLPDGGAGEEDGEVFVYYGSSTGIDPTAYDTFPGPSGAAHSYGYYLWSLNMNNDGAADLVVDDAVGGNPVQVLYGASGGLSTTGSTDFPVKNIGGVAVGDINGDGHPDLVVGSPGAGKSKTIDHGEVFVGSEGIIYVFRGTAHGFASTPAKIHGLKVGTKYGYLGSDIAIAKVNGDKYADVVAGANNVSYTHAEGAGAVVALYGSSTGLSATHRTIVGLNTPGVPGKAIGGDNLGITVAAGDVNGDGYADAIAGATQDYNGRNGEVLVVRGSKHGLKTKHSQLLKLTSLPLPDGPSGNPALYGTDIVTFNPAGLRYAAVAIGAPLYSKGSDYGDGLVDVWAGSKKGLKTSRATRTIAPTEKQFFGQVLAP